MLQKDSQKPPVVAVAKDAAFSFYYKDNLKLLEKLGAQLLEFSPLNDREIPREADASFLAVAILSFMALIWRKIFLCVSQ